MKSLEHLEMRIRAALVGAALFGALFGQAARAADWLCVQCDPPTEVFEWTPATCEPDCSPERYEVWASLAGAPEILYTESQLPQAEIAWIFGEYIEVRVRAMHGDVIGPWSFPSERERHWPDFDYDKNLRIDFVDLVIHAKLPFIYGTRIEGRQYVK